MADTVRSRYEFAALDTDPGWIEAYWELGYVILAGVFEPDEIDRIGRRFDRWYAEGMRHPSTFRHQNKTIWVEQAEGVGQIVRGMQWPSYEDDTLDAVRTDPRMLRILGPLIGGDIKQIINQLHWKAPGSNITWGLHRDVRSRKPDEAFRELGSSYVQTGLAVDRHWSGNGAMQILPRSHRQGRLDLNDHGGARGDTGESGWAKAGLDLSGLIDVAMEPGDLALWGPYTIHGGGLNTTPDSYRRLYINGYVLAANCDRGEWTFRNGQPVPLNQAEPALIQYEQVRTRTEAHYPELGAAGTKPSD
ncbi:MAG: phytanoyl-CoA dioxygenase family protein [Armatimonadetes bacterium]|nr:phytanoyl-CoA dioxygenase family protein [Armatimonadota bacterium]